MSLSTLRRVVWPAALSAAVLALAACGDDDDDTSRATTSTAPGVATTPAGKRADIAAQVPPEIRSKGTFTVATDATYAPNEFIAPDGKTVVGMDADLAKALATLMGLKAKIVNVTFDSIIPGIAAHKYDVAMTSATDNKEREEVVDFVTYFRAGTSFFTRSQGGTDVTTLADLCGKKVAIEKGTTQADDAAAQSKKCKAAGRPAVKIALFPDQNGANLALVGGRAELGMADSPVASYQVEKSGGRLKLVGRSYGVAPYGIAIPKDTGFERALLAGVKALMSDGTYAAILKKWSLESGAIDNPTINGAID